MIQRLIRKVVCFLQDTYPIMQNVLLPLGDRQIEARYGGPSAPLPLLHTAEPACDCDKTTWTNQKPHVPVCVGEMGKLSSGSPFSEDAAAHLPLQHRCW